MLNEEGDVVREYKAMHEDNFLRREDTEGEEMTKRTRLRRNKESNERGRGRKGKDRG